MSTAILFTPRYLEHDTGKGHPESPTRLRVIMDELERSGLLKVGRCSIVEPEPARIEDVELVHDSEYVDLVKRVCESGGGLLDLSDTVVSPKSFEVALLAVGGAVGAVKLVAEKKFQNAFALVRPPGHHAGRYYALGFCVFNNVAVAAENLIRYFGLKRILILDVDSHHGNGTQEIFYNTNKVLYFGLHEDPRGFPGTGFVDEVGELEGQGYTVNIPLPFRTSDKAYLKAFDQIVTPIAQQYKPEFILVSAGFDGFYPDPIGSLSLSAHIYTEIYFRTLNLSSQFCNGRLVAILEGGYHLETLGRLVSSAIARLANISYTTASKRSLHRSARLERKAERIINEVKRVQSSFWSLKDS